MVPAAPVNVRSSPGPASAGATSLTPPVVQLLASPQLTPSPATPMAALPSHVAVAAKPNRAANIPLAIATAPAVAKRRRARARHPRGDFRSSIDMAMQHAHAERVRTSDLQ